MDQVETSPIQSDEDLDELFGEEARSEEENSLETGPVENGDDGEESIKATHRLRKHKQTLPPKTLRLSPVTRPTDSGYVPYLMRIPGFVNFNAKPITGKSLTATLLDEFPGQDTFDYGDLLRAQTTIRSRRVAGDQLESNSRLNRWADGSWTLQIGHEHFEVLPQAFSEGEHNFLFVKQNAMDHDGHPIHSCMESIAKLANKLTMRPFMDATGSHRKYLALAEATGKGMKVTKVRVATTVVDPEKEKQNIIRLQQERIKARRKLDARKRNLQQRSLDQVGREGLSGRFLEEDEDAAMESDEYDEDFIDDSEIAEVEDKSEDEDLDSMREDEEDEPVEESKASESLDVTKSTKSEANRTRTSRLIFDDDDEEDE